MSDVRYCVQSRTLYSGEWGTHKFGLNRRVPGPWESFLSFEKKGAICRQVCNLYVFLSVVSGVSNKVHIFCVVVSPDEHSPWEACLSPRKFCPLQADLVSTAKPAQVGTQTSRY